MNVRGICMQTMLRAGRTGAPTLMLSLVATGLHQKALWHESARLQLLPVSPSMLEWSRKKLHKHKRDQREVNWWEEAMPDSKVKKERWCDGGTRRRRRRRGEEGFCVASSRWTWDTLHMSTSVRVRTPHSQSKVNLISWGWKRKITTQMILHPFMDGCWDEERCKPFRRRLLHWGSSP